jgi:hypothetical protein
MMTFNLEDFAATPFPPQSQSQLPGPPDAFVYVFCWLQTGQEVPFYVGQTKRLSDRLGDYLEAPFAAATDFRVGEAARYLQSKGLSLRVRYRRSDDSRKDEYHLIRQLQLRGVRLLNELQAYDYKTANQVDEREVVHRFCDVLLWSSEHALYRAATV